MSPCRCRFSVLRLIRERSATTCPRCGARSDTLFRRRLQITPIRRGWAPRAPSHLPSADTPILAICLPRSRSAPGGIVLPSGLLWREHWIRCGPGSGAGQYWLAVAGLGGTCPFRRAAWPRREVGAPACAASPGGVAALRPSEYPASRSWPQDWDLGLAGGRRRAGAHVAGGGRSVGWRGEAGQGSGRPGAGALSRAAATASRRLRRAPAA
jgi:hypothetical protein